MTVSLIWSAAKSEELSVRCNKDSSSPVWQNKIHSTRLSWQSKFRWACNLPVDVIIERVELSEIIGGMRTCSQTSAVILWIAEVATYKKARKKTTFKFNFLPTIQIAPFSKKISKFHSEAVMRMTSVSVIVKLKLHIITWHW